VTGIFAVYFKDFRIASAILNERNPLHQKLLGKQITNYDERAWNEISQSVVKRGNLEKVVFILTYNN